MKVVILNYTIASVEIVHLNKSMDGSEVERALQDMGYKLSEISYMCTDGDVPVYYYPDEAPVYKL